MLHVLHGVPVNKLMHAAYGMHIYMSQHAVCQKPFEETLLKQHDSGGS